MPVLFFACFVHELGHIAAAYLLGGRIRQLSYSAAGFKMQSGGSLSYAREIVVFASGPLCGLIASYIAAKLGFTAFSGISFLLSVFNLLPLSLLDGGRILQNILLMKLDYITAERTAKIVDICVLTVFFAFSVYMLVYFGNITLLCTSSVLLFIYCQEK